MDNFTQYWTLAIPVVMIFAVLFIYRIRMNRQRGPAQTEVRLVEKTRVSHDTFLFTFLLPEQNVPLGLRIGEHIEAV